jgi:tetratricopeptide (TPR) repeat protein
MIATGVALMMFITRPTEHKPAPALEVLSGEPSAANLDDYLAQIHAGTAAYRAQRYAEATPAFAAAVALRPSEHLPYRYLAELHWRLGKPEQAAQAVRSLARVMPEAYFLDQVGRTYEEAGLRGLAVQVYQAVVNLDPQFPSARYNLGRAFLEAGDLDAGIAEMQAALRLHPAFPEAHQALGMAYAEQGDFEAAMIHLKHALAVQPNLAVVRNHLGRLYLAQGRLDEAIQTFRVLVEQAPDIAEARHNLAIAYARQGRQALAIEQFEEALRRRPDFLAARIDLATVLLEMGRPQEAIDTLRQALATALQEQARSDEAELVEVRYRLGLAYRIAGQPQDAIRELETVLQVHPKHAGAHANLSLLYYQSQRYDHAWRHARQADALGVAMGELLAALRRVSVEPP